MPKNKYSEKIRQLKRVLEEEAEQASHKSEFVQRRSKLDGKGFVQTLVLGCLEQAGVSLNELVQVSADLNIEISPSGLNQRIDWEGVECLREVLAESVQCLQGKKVIPIEMLAPFNGVYILDSTQINLPDSLAEIFRGAGGNGAKASLKLYLSYEYLSGAIASIDLTDGCAPDQKYRQHLQSAPVGSLHLFDLGFFKQEHFAELVEAEAYFVSRVQSQTALYWHPDDETSLEVAAFTQSIRGDACEIEVYMGQRARVPVRVLFQRLPAAVVAERRRKANAKMRRDKKTPSQRYLQLLEWAIFMTNVSPAHLPFQHVLRVYRVRWQVEILFKIWKSEAHLEQVGDWRPARVLCQIFARLIGLMLFHWLVAPYRLMPQGELSFDKAFHILQRHLPALAQAIACDWRPLSALLSHLEKDFLRFARKDSRKKSPSTYQTLCLATP